MQINNILWPPDDFCQPNRGMIGNVCLRPVSCRDKGWMWSRVGALCLSWWHDAWSGLREATRSPPHHEDKHKAPSSPPLRPLSLQDAGRTFPDSVGNIH